jgi:hypothetical protein
MRHLDQEIRAVETRIARERDGMVELLDDCGETARDKMTAPRSLLAVAAVGFVLGEVLHPRRRVAPARIRGLGAIVAGVAMGLLQARYGSPWALLAQRVLSQGARRGPRTEARPRYGPVNAARK